MGSHEDRSGVRDNIAAVTRDDTGDQGNGALVRRPRETRCCARRFETNTSVGRAKRAEDSPVASDDTRQDVSQLVDRVTRIVRLNLVLREHAGAVETDRLCRQLGVSKRTLQRDVSVLRAAGESIDYLRGEKGYRMALPAAAAVEVLCVKEIAAILTALDGAARDGDSEFDEFALSAGAKLRGVLEADFPSIVSEVEKWSRAFSPPDDAITRNAAQKT